MKWRYLGGLISNGSRSTIDIIALPDISMVKRQNHVYKAYIKSPGELKTSYNEWSIAVYGKETWTLIQKDRD